VCVITANRCIQVVIKPINAYIYPPVARHTHVRMEKAASKRNKRSPSFTAGEMAVLVDEVWQPRNVLFGGTKGKKDIALKNRIWQAIAQKMSPSSPCDLRDWGAVRKKWQEFQSKTKKKRAKVRRESMGTGGCTPGATTLTPDEEKVLSIIGKTASERITGGIDLLGDEGFSENTESEGEEEPSGSRAVTYTSPGEDDPPQLSPAPARRPAGPGVRMRGGLTGFYLCSYRNTWAILYFYSYFSSYAIFLASVFCSYERTFIITHGFSIPLSVRYNFT